MVQAFMVIGDVCQMNVQCAGHTLQQDICYRCYRVLCVEAGQALSLPKCLFGSQHELILAIECSPMCVCTSRTFPK